MMLGRLLRVTDLCGLKPQFDDEGADGNFFSLFCDRFWCRKLHSFRVIVGVTMYVLFLSWILWSKQHLKYVFASGERGQDMMNRVSNNLVDRIDLLALWLEEMLYIKLNHLTQCFTFSMIFLHVRMDWGKIFSFNLGERIIKQNWAAIVVPWPTVSLVKRYLIFHFLLIFPLGSWCLPLGNLEFFSVKSILRPQG